MKNERIVNLEARRLAARMGERKMTAGWLSTVTEVTIHIEGTLAAYGNAVTKVSLDDGEDGPFIYFSQRLHSDGKTEKVIIGPEELPMVIEAATLLLNQLTGKATK
jgi:hypothetical protein